MPQILVVTDTPSDDGSTVVYWERISATDLESSYFSGQLVERVGWAVSDASALERDQGRRLRVVGLAAPPQASAPQR